MDAREANRRTLEAYEHHVDAYLATGPAVLDATLLAFLDRVAAVAPGGRVLELGSGPGACADAMEERGLTVRRTDATVAFVQRLRSLGRDADVLDALHDDLGGPYDVVFANAVLLHFAADDLEQLLQRATQAAMWCAFTVKEGDGEAWTTAKLDAPRWFVYWREEPLRALLRRSGWEVRSLQHTDGRHDAWITVLARRA